MMLARKNNYGYDLFDDLFNDNFFTVPQRESALMKTDIREKGDQYLLDIELPGFKKEDVQAELTKGYLTITAEHTDKSEEKDEKGKYLKRERFSGSCKRSFYIGENIRQEDIHAAFKDGMLILSIPKNAPKKEDTPALITIE